MGEGDAGSRCPLLFSYVAGSPATERPSTASDSCAATRNRAAACRIKVTFKIEGETDVRRIILVSLLVWGIVAGSAAFAAQKTATVKANRDAGFEEFSRMLGLTKKQQDSIKAIVTRGEADMRKLAASKESDKTKQTKMRTLMGETQRKFLAVLTPAQKQKYAQMMQKAQTAARSQQRKAPTVRGNSPQPQPANRMTFAEAMAKRLSRVKLTSQQKTKTDAILKDFAKKHAANKKDSKLDPAKKRAKADALKGEAMQKINAVLTASQRAAFEKGL